MRSIFRILAAVVSCLVLMEFAYYSVSNKHLLDVSLRRETMTSMESTSTEEGSLSAVETSASPFVPIHEPMKTILVWNAYYRVEVRYFGYGHESFARNCPVGNCLMTTDRSLVPMDQFDAILFNVPLLFNVSRKFPKRWQRKPHQRYIFFSQESPVYNVEDMRRHEGVFNWTMSYQTFSDIPLPYGRYARRKPSDPPVRNWNTNRKTKMVAWFASHCGTQSKRELYVERLKRHIDVDVYGWCGTLKCQWDMTAGISTPGCYEMLERDYMFYLSFENSFCVDYVTEKLFAILDLNVVPVVMGGANYSRFAPPNSYIDALQYTPRQLAEYLKRVASDRTLYEQYFAWKKHYVIYSGLEAMATESFCHLCEKLHRDRQVKVYNNLQETWSENAQCPQPKFYLQKGF